MTIDDNIIYDYPDEILYGCIQDIEKIESNIDIHEKYNKVKVSKYGMLFITANKRTRINFPLPEFYMNDVRFRQVIRFIGNKIGNEIIIKGADDLWFDVNELVEANIYENTSEAIREFEQIATFLCGIGIGTKDRQIIDIFLKDREVAFTAFSLFTFIGIEAGGKIQVIPNNCVNWKNLIVQN